MFATAPLFGIGFGHYALMSGRFTGYAIESHNWYANVLAEQGLVGVALWIPMLAAIAIQLLRAPRAARSVGLAVFVVYATGSAFLQPPLSVQTSAFAVIVVVAALVGDWSRFAATEQRPIDGAAEHAAATAQSVTPGGDPLNPPWRRLRCRGTGAPTCPRRPRSRTSGGRLPGPPRPSLGVPPRSPA